MMCFSWLIMVVDAFDHWVLRHRFYWVCAWVGESKTPMPQWNQDYWGNNEDT